MTATLSRSIAGFREVSRLNAAVVSCCCFKKDECHPRAGLLEEKGSPRVPAQLLSMGARQHELTGTDMCHPQLSSMPMSTSQPPQDPHDIDQSFHDGPLAW